MQSLVLQKGDKTWEIKFFSINDEYIDVVVPVNLIRFGESL